jgi:hypothetical protein
MKRDRAETDKRIRGSTLLPICEIFDPAAESKIAAESTNWRQLYPLVDGAESAIENALAMAKTTTVASIENGAFRARQKAVQLQIQEMNHRENTVVRKPTITKVLVPPFVYVKRRSSLPIENMVDRHPIVESVAEPLAIPEVAAECPIEMPEVVVGLPLFPGFAPMVVDPDEEAERLHVIVGRAVASRTAGIDRVIASLYRIKPKGEVAPAMVKTRQSLLSIPVVKAPTIHQIP